jgi:hypothetical protein
MSVGWFAIEIDNSVLQDVRRGLGKMPVVGSTTDVVIKNESSEGGR